MSCSVWLNTLIAAGKLVVTFYGSEGLIVMDDREERMGRR